MMRGSRVMGFVVACGLVLGACGGGGSDDAGEEPEPDPGPSTSAAEEPGGETAATDPADSVVTVETALTSGTGLVFDRGYVVVPSDIVDPFFAVDVYVDGEPRVASVTGVDLVTGLAVLGPVDLSGAPSTPLDPEPVVPGEDLSLLVAPDPGDDGEPTVVEGRVDALDEVEGWPVGLVDIAVDRGVGTVGAPVLDADGRVVGLGGFATGDGIEVAVDAATALRSIETIRGGDGDWPHIPDAPSASEQEATIDLSFDGSVTLFFPTDWHPGEQELTLPPDTEVQMQVLSYANETLLVNPAAEAAGLGEDDDPDLVEPAPDGTYELRYRDDDDTGAGVLVYLTVPDGAPAPTALEVTSPYDFVVTDPVPEAKDVPLGAPVEGLLGAFEDTARFTVELAAGEEATVTAASPTGDVAVEVRAPDGAMVAEAEDGEGYLGLDATTSFTAAAAGTYEVRVRQQDGIATAYRLTVETA